MTPRSVALREWAAAVKLAVTSSFLLILGLILLWRRGVTAYVTAFTWQSIVLAAVTVTVAHFGHDHELYWVAGALVATRRAASTTCATPSRRSRAPGAARIRSGAFPP